MERVGAERRGEPHRRVDPCVNAVSRSPYANLVKGQPVGRLRLGGGGVWLVNRQLGCRSAGIDFWCAGWNTRCCAETSACCTTRCGPSRFRSSQAAVLAVVVVAVCAILAFLRPNAGLGDAAIVMSRDSGALYVRIGDTLHPVLNLASARLVTGSGARPGNRQRRRHRQGQARSAPGHPRRACRHRQAVDRRGIRLDGMRRHDHHGDRRPARGHRSSARQPSVLVTPRSESAATTYLLYDGWRAEVDLRNPAVVWALRLDGIEPRPVSRALLDAIPEAPPIAPPHIPGAGLPGAVAGLRVGTVVRVTRVDADDYFVVLADGVQRIGEVAANLIRITDSQGSREIASVSPDAVGDVPVVDSLPVSTFPRRAGTPIGAGGSGVLCAQWLPDGPKTVLWVGDSLPAELESDRAGAGRWRRTQRRQRRDAARTKCVCASDGPHRQRRR